jgi:UDP-N-acetylmuramate dehydrogenase
MILQENIALAPLTTLQVGGAARYFVEATSETEVREAVDWARSRDLPVFVLGGGSNLVVSDDGWPGLVLKIGLLGIEEHSQGDKGHDEPDRVRFLVGAGEEWDRFVSHAVGKNCAGIECMSGIPGSVGGTPVQNVGAYGQEASETIRSVLALNLKDMQTREIAAADCGFSYRRSIFNSTQREQYILLRVTYELIPGGAPSIRYTDLLKHFAGWKGSPTLAQTRDAVRTIRATKAMLITPGDEDCRSAGSFFKNPVLSDEEYQELVARAAERTLQVPSYPMASSERKVSAAWLVEHSGFVKGYGFGTVGISRKHALAIVNRGGATAADIFDLKYMIEQRVREQWGVQLTPEPVFVGFEGDSTL